VSAGGFRWPTRRDLEAAPLICRAKPSWGQGTIRSWENEWYFLPDVGQPIMRVGGGYDPAAMMPAEYARLWKAAEDVMQLRFEGVA
jgi:hypothetical protein